LGGTQRTGADVLAIAPNSRENPATELRTICLPHHCKPATSLIRSLSRQFG